MDGILGSERVSWPHLRVAEIGTKTRRWQAHSPHRPAPGPHGRSRPWTSKREEHKIMPAIGSSSHGDRDQVVLDGSRGEGGGQILRTALTLSL